MSDPRATGLASPIATDAAASEWASIRPYTVPIIVFGILTALEGLVPGQYVLAYSAKVVAVTAALLYWRAPLAEIQPTRRALAPSMAIGLAVFVVWVGLGTFVPYSHLGERTAFDPFDLGSTRQIWLFLIVRFYGLVLLVPVMEELFWRSFLLRYLTKHSFRSLPVGTFSSGALLIMVVFSAVAHPEWLAAALASLAYALWLRRTGSLFTVVVAHATTNALLGVYVMATGNWLYW